MEEYGINYKNTLDRYEGEYKDGYYDRIGIYNWIKLSYILNINASRNN